MNEASFFRAKVFRGSCYGSKAWEIEFKFGADNEFSAEISDGLQKKSFSPERGKLENYLKRIFGIIEKEEVLSGLRHVEISYHAELEWQNMKSFAKKSSGKLKLMSNEWQTEEIELSISEAANVEIADSLQKILDTNPHRHALEIYSLTMKFILKYRLELFQ